MELRIWLFLALVLVSMFAVLATGLAVVLISKRVTRLESRVNDLDLWTDCVDKSVDPVTAYEIQEKYTARKRTGG